MEFATATVDMVQEHGHLGSESWNTGRKHSKKCTRHEREQAIPFQNCDWKEKQSDYILVKKRSMNYGMEAVANVSIDRLGSRPLAASRKTKTKEFKAK